MKTKTMTCSGCGGVLPTHNAWCDVLRPRLDPAPADFLRAAVVQERKAKEAAEAERDRLRAALEESERSVAEWRKYAEDSGNRVAELVHAHYAERADVDAYRIGGGSESWNKRRHDYCLPMPGGTERDNRCNVCKGVDARRAAEANPSAKIGNVVAQAVSAERERCARIVEAYTNTDPDRAIAAAAAQIRSGR